MTPDTTPDERPKQKPNWPAPIDPAEIDEQRAKGWPDFHPETYCHKCGRTNPTWWIDTAMWNQTHGDDYVTVLCPSCFTIAWEKQAGGRIIWELRPDTRTGAIRRGEVSLPADLEIPEDQRPDMRQELTDTFNAHRMSRVVSQRVVGSRVVMTTTCVGCGFTTDDPAAKEGHLRNQVIDLVSTWLNKNAEAAHD